MTPLEIEILLHYYCSNTNWVKDHIESPASDEAHKFLYANKLIENKENGFMTTERGDFMVNEGLKKVQIPVYKKTLVFPEK